MPQTYKRYNQMQSGTESVWPWYNHAGFVFKKTEGYAAAIRY